MTYKNVAQPYSLYDSVGVVGNLSEFGRIPPGWTSTFQLLGQGGDVHFFDMRNKGDTGKMYCNQDARDLMNYGFSLRSLSVDFIGPNVAAELIDNEGTGYDHQIYGYASYEARNTAIWSAEIPHHCGFELKINQDTHLKTNVAMCGTQTGMTGGGFGNLMDNNASGISYAANLTSIHGGMPMLRNCWQFPLEIGIPRKAAISAVIKPSEWCKSLMQTMKGPGAYPIRTESPPWTSNYKKIPFLYLIRVTLNGVRYIQQRGGYHA